MVPAKTREPFLALAEVFRRENSSGFQLDFEFAIIFGIYPLLREGVKKKGKKYAFWGKN